MTDKDFPTDENTGDDLSEIIAELHPLLSDKPLDEEAITIVLHHLQTSHPLAGCFVLNDKGGSNSLREKAALNILVPAHQIVFDNIRRTHGLPETAVAIKPPTCNCSTIHLCAINKANLDGTSLTIAFTTSKCGGGCRYTINSIDFTSSNGQIYIEDQSDGSTDIFIKNAEGTDIAEDPSDDTARNLIATAHALIIDLANEQEQTAEQE